MQVLLVNFANTLPNSTLSLSFLRLLTLQEVLLFLVSELD